MHVTVTNLGVPLGTTELLPAGLATAELVPLPAYASVRGTIRAASAFLWHLGILAEIPAAGGPLDPAALSRAAVLPLELRGPGGELVPADYVNILERPDAAEAPVVVARFHHAPAFDPVPGVALPRGDADRKP